MSGVTVVGLDELGRTLRQLEKNVGKLSKSALIAGGLLVETDAKRSIQETSTGHIVTRYREGGWGSYQHLASGEGQAPNTDTGRLVSSINTEPTKDAVFVGTSLQYGKFLEFGTKNMKERPWLIPALKKNEHNILDLQIDAINTVIRINQEHV